MTVLIDTHVYVWAAYEPGRLSVTAREMLESPQTVVVWSAASTWELAIKVRLGRADFPADILDRLE